MSEENESEFQDVDVPREEIEIPLEDRVEALEVAVGGLKVGVIVCCVCCLLLGLAIIFG